MPGGLALTYHPLYDGRGFSPVRRSWLRYPALVHLLKGLRLFSRIERIEQRPATAEALLAVHPASYVEYVARRDAEGVGFLDRRDTPAWHGVYARALAAVGGTLEAADMIGQGHAAHVFNPGGGLHHAHRARTAGFCIFNDLVLAVRRLQRRYGWQRIAIVDVDGHHGDGTQELLYDEPILYVSLHQYDGRFFPGTGGEAEVGWGAGYGYTVNVPLPRGVGDAAFLAAFRETVPATLRGYQPDVLLLNAGVDGHIGDPLVSLGLTTAAYRAVAAEVHDLAHELCGGRLLITGSGGYHPIHAARSWAMMLAVLTGDVPGSAGPLPSHLGALQNGTGSQ